MIKDNLENIERYSINKEFEKFKKTIRLNGDHPMDLRLPLKAIPLEYQTKKFDLKKFENHKKNIDIHFVVEGSELIGINRFDNLKPTTEYDEDNDYQLFEGEVKESIILNSGDFFVVISWRSSCNWRGSYWIYCS